MPFDFKKFDAKCANMSTEELQREWEHYTRLISGAATSTAVSGVALPFTLGVSAIGVGMAAPAIHNARKKREIIERHLQRQGTVHNTRKRDVFAPMAISGTVGVVTLGVGSFGADQIANAGAEHGISMIVENEMAVKAGTHLALDVAVAKGEDIHATHKKEKVALKAFERANAPTVTVTEVGPGVCTPAANSQPEQYPPVSVPQPYGFHSDSDSKSTHVQEVYQGYPPSYSDTNLARTMSPAPPYPPPVYSEASVQSSPEGPESDLDLQPPPLPRRPTEKSSAYEPMATFSPIVMSPSSQATPIHSPKVSLSSYNETSPSQAQASIVCYPKRKPVSSNGSPSPPHPMPAADLPLEKHNERSYQPYQQTYQSPVQTYASYPTTMLPVGHPGQCFLPPAYSAHTNNTTSTSTVTYLPTSMTKPQHQPQEMPPPSPYTLPPTPISSPPIQPNPSFPPPPPRTPVTAASVTHQWQSPVAPIQNSGFPPPHSQQQYLYSPPPTPFSTSTSRSQPPDGYFPNVVFYPPPAAQALPTPAQTPQSGYFPEKQYNQMRPGAEAPPQIYFPPPPTSPYTR